MIMFGPSKNFKTIFVGQSLPGANSYSELCSTTQRKAVLPSRYVLLYQCFINKLFKNKFNFFLVSSSNDNKWKLQQLDWRKTYEKTRFRLRNGLYTAPGSHIFNNPPLWLKKTPENVCTHTHYHAVRQSKQNSPGE